MIVFEFLHTIYLIQPSNVTMSESKSECSKNRYLIVSLFRNLVEVAEKNDGYVSRPRDPSDPFI
jgi:hypothetical protein